eukprot:655732-Rhodomonas_salina.1
MSPVIRNTLPGYEPPNSKIPTPNSSTETEKVYSGSRTRVPGYPGSLPRMLLYQGINIGQPT